MRTSEFIRRVEDLGYKVSDIDNSIVLYCENAIIGQVGKNKVNKIDTLWEEDIPRYIFDLCVEYVRTPIEEREDVKKYYLYNPVRKQYFNYYIKENTYVWNNSTQMVDIQTQFTQKEIENHEFKDIMELLEKVEIK